MTTNHEKETTVVHLCSVVNNRWLMLDGLAYDLTDQLIRSGIESYFAKTITEKVLSFPRTSTEAEP